MPRVVRAVFSADEVNQILAERVLVIRGINYRGKVDVSVITVHDPEKPTEIKQARVEVFLYSGEELPPAPESSDEG